MGDSFITIVLILIAATLIFVVPVVAVSARNDVTAEQTVQTAVTNFVDTVRETRNNKARRLLEIITRDRINWK